MRLVSLVVGVLTLCWAAPAQARSYYLNRVEVEAQVRTDGSMHVRETREVVFSGSYRAFDRAIPLPRATWVENLTVAEEEPYRQEAGEAPGTFTAQVVVSELRISWFYSDTETRPNRIFTLEYDVQGAVRKHGDVAELYWQFIEPKRDWKALSSRVIVTLPRPLPPSEVRAWAHGPLTGVIGKADDRVILVCNPLLPDQMVEARILFPTSVITSSPRQDAELALDKVLQEEGRWAEEANRARVRARVGLALPPLLVAAGVAIWLALFLLYGREYQQEIAAGYEREPLQGWTPVEAGYLWRWGSLGPQDMTATLMDLVRRGALKLITTSEARPRLGGLLGTAREEEHYLERVPGFRGEMSASERYLVNEILFHDVASARISLDAFREGARRNPTGAYGRFRHWQKLAQSEWRRPPLIEPRSKVAMGAGIALGAIMFGSAFVTIPALQSPLGFLPAMVGIALIPASTVMRRRNPEAAAALHHWQAFRRYLADFSRLEEHPAPAVSLWEQYLVFAVTLGVAERVIEQFKALYPQVVREGAGGSIGFANWVSSSGSMLDNMDSISSAFSSFSSSFTAAASSFSSSSGGGGGFSGGGGGGGGGGSSGAR